MQFDHRRRWGGSGTSPAAQLLRTQGVTIHWLGTSYASRSHSQCLAYVRQLRDAHLAHPKENYIDIAYNLLACEHGYVIEGRGAGKRSGANGTASLNIAAYSVCALYGTDSGKPSPALLNALVDAIEYLRDRGAGKAISYHGQNHPTKCPGPELTSWVKSGARRPATEKKVHRVSRGETLSYLAQKYKVTVDDFVRANKIKNPNYIRVGQRLIVPEVKKVSKPGPKMYTPPPFPVGIRPNRKDPSARDLQKVMKALGIMPKSIRYADNYGPRTQDAVAAFHDRYPQFKSSGVSRDIYIGPKGWAFAHAKAYGS